MTARSSFSLRVLTRLSTMLLLLSACAAADTFIMPTGVDWSRGESLWINADGADVDAYFAGVIFISLTQNGQQYNRDTLCVDLFTDIYLGVTYNTTLLNPTEVPGKNLERISWLVDNALLPTQGPTYTSYLPTTDWVTSVAQGAGIQLAIWDITHDGGDGFSSGRVQASTTPGEQTDPAVLYWAKTYEALSSGQSSAAAFVYDNTGIGTGTPAQMLAGPMFTDGGPVPAPEPALTIIVGLTLIGMSLGLRRYGPAASKVNKD